MRISGAPMPEGALPHVCLMSVYRWGVSHAFNAVLPIHSLKGKVFGVIPALQ